ncbi:class I SAM-dependent methyltransferase [Caulobacter vibrioides]|uniref:class I SAM-dependent methyltransferase n=1 Tax=Caulobacter vibrioides TaxID=155892 RepID=UPI000BB4D2F1|nr:class I SAM-dependent methyltransferase [Caulobacter vibrioides]ATC23502.1 class I SAM-dependent methyltransferase [Caulobacter vibrioides]AZH11720.1 class I SAM-dependent methyltransferase [Caulobacter vibrioides]PLR11911.1 class I SAM-dependent methyltransferase [Caulobacter vibrioides]
MSLLDRLKAQIAQDGPIGVPEFFTRCLHDPRDGYYATRPDLGAGGDFITAPLVSQMFGELIGLWVLETWTRMGRPAPFRLVEMGPGDGTLMSDLLRAGRLDPAFLEAAQVWLVEVSEPLKARQAARLGEGPRWASRLDEVPGGAPMILVANELLDCLPARQFIRTRTGWAERVIGLGADSALAFGLRAINPPPRGGGVRVADGGGSPVGHAPSPSGPSDHLPRWGEELEAGAVVESSPAQAALASDIAHRLVIDGGAALLIDYGRAELEPGDTLQAIQNHRKVDPLETAGLADLTVWADFPSVITAARETGAKAGPILTQGAFLVALGIIQRAEALAARQPERGDQIARQLDRLIGEAQMGDLFKVACLCAPDLSPPLFEDAT